MIVGLRACAWTTGINHSNPIILFFPFLGKEGGVGGECSIPTNIKTSAGVSGRIYMDCSSVIIGEITSLSLELYLKVTSLVQTEPLEMHSII